MKNLRFSATITAVLGFLSIFALIVLFLALTDIANHEPNLTLEWYLSGICIFVLGIFIISTFVTLGFLLKYIMKN
jgi:hypothetical protein